MPRHFLRIIASNPIAIPFYVGAESEKQLIKLVGIQPLTPFISCDLVHGDKPNPSHSFEEKPVLSREHGSAPAWNSPSLLREPTSPRRLECKAALAYPEDVGVARGGLTVTAEGRRPCARR